MGKLWHFMGALLAVYLLAGLSSCSKDWLEAKPDKSVIVPSTVGDLQLLLDNHQVFNIYQASGLGEISAGDFYISQTSWLSLFNVQERSAYIWEKTADFYKGEQSADWQGAYARILNANLVLKSLQGLKPGADPAAWNNVKGCALFFRAFDFFNLAQEYCKVYDAGSALVELGLPLRLDYDVNISVKRANLQETYDQVIKDLKEAAPVLDKIPLYKTQPSRQAVYALLARTYLSMERYAEAGLYVDSALQIQHQLMDYSKLPTNGTYSIARFNPEVIFHSTFTYGIFNTSRLLVEPALLNAYAENDLRKRVFFTPVNNGMTYRGSYGGDKNLFGGLATDELYLIRAESSARLGALDAALKDLNRLLQTRWSGNYTTVVAHDQDAVLRYILAERRKELAFRGLRWTDLRRLNKDSRFAVNLSRTINGQTYILTPGDKRYVLPIDEIEIKLADIPQNDR